MGKRLKSLAYSLGQSIDIFGTLEPAEYYRNYFIKLAGSEPKSRKFKGVLDFKDTNEAIHHHWTQVGNSLRWATDNFYEENKKKLITGE